MAEEKEGRNRMQKERCEFTILIPDIIEKVTGTESELYLSKEALFPPGYMDYLVEVLNVNQRLAAVVGETEVWRLAKQQLGRLWDSTGKSGGKVMEVWKNGKIVGVVVSK